MKEHEVQLIAEVIALNLMVKELQVHLANWDQWKEALDHKVEIMEQLDLLIPISFGGLTHQQQLTVTRRIKNKIRDLEKPEV